LDYVLLVIVQLVAVTVLSFFIAFIIERPALNFSYSYNTWGAIAFMAVFATAFAFYMQNRFQRHSTATKTAIIFSGEPLFSGIFGYIMLSEQLGLIAWLGGLSIILGMIVSQWALDK